MTEDTRSIIRKATFEMLKSKDYKDIQMKEIAEAAHVGRRTLYRNFGCKDEIMNNVVESLMDDLVVVINQTGRMDIEGIAYAYFLFWERNMEILRLLKKAHLMYLFEDNLPELMVSVSLKTKYKNKTKEELIEIKNSITVEAKYNYYYMLAGYVKVAELWMEEDDKRAPEQMAKILKGIVTRDFPGM